MVAISPPTVKTAKADRKALKFTSRKQNSLFGSPIASFVAIIIALVWTIPTFGLFISSIRTPEDINNTGWWTFLTNPSFTLENYNTVLFEGSSVTPPLSLYFLNSFAITIPGTVFPVVLATFAAYALAWFDFKGRDFLFYTIFAMQVIPLQLALIPLLQLFANGLQIGDVTLIPALGITGTYIPIWIAHTMFAMPIAIFLLHNFLSQIPRELMEAARVDGADAFKTFRMVVLPLSIPAIASFAIFQFLWVWNDLLVGLDVRWRKAGDRASHGSSGRTHGNSRRRLGATDGRSVRVDHCAGRGVLRSAALLRARTAGGFGQGLGATRTVIG